MTEKTWPRGAEWRKWDLHVHSPASHGFKGDYNQFIIQLGNADCGVIGINDYFSVAGYREVLRNGSVADFFNTIGQKRSLRNVGLAPKGSSTTQLDDVILRRLSAGGKATSRRPPRNSGP